MHDRLRGSRRRDDADPGSGFETRHRLRDGRNLRRERGALEARDAERADLTLLHLRPDVGHIVEHDIDVARKQVGQCRRAAAVWHVLHVGMCHQLEQFAREVNGAAGAGAAKVDFAGAAFQEVDEFGHGFGRHRSRVHHKEVGKRREQGDGVEALYGVVLQVSAIGRKHGVGRGGGNEQGVAVRRGAHDIFPSDRAGSTGLVLDDDGLAPFLGDELAGQSCDDIGRAACRERNHELDGLGRIGVVLRLRGGRREDNCGRDCNGMGPGRHGFLCVLRCVVFDVALAASIAGYPADE